jgi:hypothetical protein
VEAAGQRAREEVHLVITAVLAALAVQRDRDDDVGRQEARLAADQLQ